MKNKRPKKIIVQKELEKLMKEFTPGNSDAWELAKWFIETIEGLEHEEELFLKKKLQEHLVVVIPENAGTRNLLDIAGGINQNKK